jgi:predicted TIM-barrel fold metal-dependent hydrolase
VLADAHCHFFSREFFNILARQRGGDSSGLHLCLELGWDDPGTAWTLADRWIQELDAHGVGRAAIIASVPGDATSVAAAVARHPQRLVGFFMLDATPADAVERTVHAVNGLGLRGICLFPAMHHVPLDDERVSRVVDVAARHPGTAVFVHCGTLSVGVRKKLGLPSAFNLELGDPLAVARLATAFPEVPFIIPHFGAGRLEDALIAATSCANVYLDTSSSNSWIANTPGLTLESVFASALAAAGPSRLLFGTDSSFFPRGWQRATYADQRAALTSLGVSAADQTLIFAGNFERLFPVRAG